MTVQLKRNDTKDVIRYSMTYNDGSVVNLTGATVRFVMGIGNTLITNAPATIADAAGGIAEYTLTDADTLVAGNLQAEFEVTFSDGKVKTFPNDGYISVKIKSNIDKDKSTYVSDTIALRVSDIEVFKTDINAKVDQAAADAAKVNDFENRIDNIVSQAGNDNTEIVDSRLRKDGTVAPTLGTHVRELATSVAEKAKQTDLNLKADKTYVDTVKSGTPKIVKTTLVDLNSSYPTGSTDLALVTGNVKEVDTLNITASPTAAGNITVTLNGVATNIAVTSGVKEVASLTVTAVPTTAGNVTVTLNGVATNIAVDPSTDTTTDLVATKIRNAVYSTGAVTDGTASTVTFTAAAVGTKTDATYSSGSTGATGTMSTTTQGVDADTITSVATKIRGTTFSGWTTGGTGTTVTFTKSTGGTNTTPTYSVGSTGATGTISVTTSGTNTDGNWYYWNGSAWIVGWTYQATGIASGSINSTHIAQGGVKASNVSFLKQGKNLLNLNTAIIGKFLNNGSLGDNATYDTSDYIAVTPSTQYSVSVGVRFVEYYDASKVYISGTNFSNPTSPLTTHSGASFMRITIWHNTLNTCLVELGTTSTSYESFGYKHDTVTEPIIVIPARASVDNTKIVDKTITVLQVADNTIENRNLKDGTIQPEKCSDLILKALPSKNLFNKATSATGYFVNWQNGSLSTNSDYTYSDYIYLKSNTNYTHSFPCHLAFYDVNKTFVRGFDKGTNTAYFTTASNEVYVRVSWTTSEHSLDTYQWEEGTVPTAVTQFGYVASTKANGIDIIFPSSQSSAPDKYLNSRFYGKKVSWYGTSITQGYTWCGLVNSKFGFIATNNGVGGTAICNENQLSSMCNTERMLGQYSNVTDPNTGAVTPNGVPIPSDVEVIFIEGGTNDWARNWSIGTTRFSQTPNDQEFYGACDKMFRNLSSLFPNAEIIIVGSPFGKMVNRDAFTNKYGVLNNQNLQTVEYGDMLLQAAGRWGFKGTNIGRLMQVNDNNISSLIPDGLHLTTQEAQKRASDVIIQYLLTL